MKKRVLLIDESLTVQKVVALTLDRNRYAVSYAKSRSEAMKEVLQNPPDLILASDQVSDINITSFPKEVESWAGRERRVPPMILITGQDIKEMRHYKAVLRKPFSPQALQAVVVEHTRSADEGRAETAGHAATEEEDSRLQKIFNDTFADEAKLTRETFEADAEDDERTLLTIPAPAEAKPWASPAGGPNKGKGASPGRAAPRNEAEPEHRATLRPPADDGDVWDETGESTTPRPSAPPPQESPAELWGAPPKGTSAKVAAPAKHEIDEPEPRTPATAKPAASAHELMGAEDSVAYKQVLEKQVETHLRNHDLEAVMERVLNRLMPPIVERLVQERLDKLLKEQEQFVELKQ